MAKYGKIWDGNFNLPVNFKYKISFCTTCMNRLENLKETLPKNIEQNISYPLLEFVVLDYNSKDGLGEWIRKEMMDYINNGKLSYFRTDEPEWFSMAHSRNIAFKVASGHIVNNLDADNWTIDENGDKNICLAEYINNQANQMSRKAIFAKGKRGIHGRIGFYKDEFIKELGGYDEDFEGYGHDDHDLLYRAWALDYTMMWWGGQYYSRIKTNGKMKIENMKIKNWRETEKINKIKHENNMKNKIYKANQNKEWGKARLIKNFNEEINI